MLRLPVPKENQRNSQECQLYQVSPPELLLLTLMFGQLHKHDFLCPLAKNRLMVRAHEALKSSEETETPFMKLISWPLFARDLLGVRECEPWGCWLQEMYEGQLKPFFGEEPSFCSN